MKKGHNLIRVFSGTETLAIILKGKLEEYGISSLTKNDSVTAYLEGTPPPSVDLYIQELDFEKAAPVISDFLKTNNI